MGKKKKMLLLFSFVCAGGRKDLLTGQKRNKANNISFSNKKTRKWQEVNLQRKKIYWYEGHRSVNLRIATKTIKTIDKKGLSTLAKKNGIDLWKIPFKDYRNQRLEYIAKNVLQVPVKKSIKNKIKNSGKFENPNSKPMVPRYIGGRIFWIRYGTEEEVYSLFEEQMETAMENKNPNI